MDKHDAHLVVNNFIDNQELQKWVANALDYCAALSAAIAETHGFHEDEQNLKKLVETAQSEKVEWLETQLLQAEFGRVMSEAGEAIENIRKPGPDDKCPQYPGWHVEAIDILVRVFDTLGKRGIAPGEVFVAKTLVNNGRPYKHDKNS